MELSFSLFYTVPGLNFNDVIPFKMMKKVNFAFEKLSPTIPLLEKRFQTTDYNIHLIINTTINPEKVVRGPAFLRKSKTVEFVIWIPYEVKKNYEEQLSYVLHQIGAAIVVVFEKYGGDASEVNAIVESIIQDGIAHHQPEIGSGNC